MRICHIVPSLEERHGGPSKSVRALADAQTGLGAPVELLSTHAQPVAPSIAANSASVRVFQREFPQWLCPSNGLKEHLSAASYDLVHYHSLWLRLLAYAHTTSRQRGVPLVLAPRGMMSDWAWQHHRWQKFLVNSFVHPGALAGAAGWHATSREEADDIRRRGFTQPVCVAPNGVGVPADEALAMAGAHWRKICPSAANRRVALFYSRFHRKKRLRELIDLWSASATGDWLLLLAGLPEEYSVAEINGWITAAQAGSRIAVFDSTGHPPPYAAASLFLLPSHSENFGLVVAEALAAGVPVLTTDGTPWRELDSRGAGWCATWADFPAALRRALTADEGNLAAMGARGRVWMRREFTWEGSARLLLDFYRQLRHDN
jgi:glycosyltransferase involved in cell wall biosynthesis